MALSAGLPLPKCYEEGLTEAVIDACDPLVHPVIVAAVRRVPVVCVTFFAGFLFIFAEITAPCRPGGTNKARTGCHRSWP